METTPLLAKQDMPTNSGWQYRIAVCVFALQGIGFLLPWNVFHIVARPYYIEYKLNSNETQPAYYQDYFFSWLGLFTQVPSLLINLYSVVTAFHGNGVYRIYLCLSTIIGVLAVTLSFVFVDTSTWPEGFFWMTMASVALLCTANGLYENSLWGFVADFPPQFVNYVVIGNNVCGVFISLAAIFSITVAPSGNAKIAASIYFFVALGTAVCCLKSFFLLGQMPYARFYRQKSKYSSLGYSQIGNLRDHVCHLIITLKEKWREMLSVFLTFFVTLALYPAVIGKVEPSGQINLPKDLFHPVLAYLHLNLLALIGNILADRIRCRPSTNVLLVATISRIAFIPLFLMCNFEGDERRYPAVLANDIAFVVLIFLLAISQGYLSSISMIYASKDTETSDSNICGMLAGFFLIFGICAGANFTFLENLLMHR